MIDKRKREWDYPNPLKEYIELLENDGFVVTYLKQNNANSKLMIRDEKNDIDMPDDFSHDIKSGVAYYELFKNTLYPTRLKYVELMRKQNKE